MSCGDSASCEPYSLLAVHRFDHSVTGHFQQASHHEAVVFSVFHQQNGECADRTFSSSGFTICPLILTAAQLASKLLILLYH